eukprot:4829544-Amphidinium_carterae.1
MAGSAGSVDAARAGQPLAVNQPPQVGSLQSNKPCALCQCANAGADDITWPDINPGAAWLHTCWIEQAWHEQRSEQNFVTHPVFNQP